jgi:hypothetical protein
VSRPGTRTASGEAALIAVTGDAVSR